MSRHLWVATPPLAMVLRYTVIILSLLVLLELLLFSIEGGVDGQQPSASLPSFNTFNPVKMSPQSKYDELVQRALFSPDRKPKDSVQPTTTSVQGKASENWLLAGVVISGTDSYAMFSEKNGQRRLKLELGTLMDEWKVETISADQVVLLKNGERDTLHLLVSEPKKKPKRVVRNKARSSTRTRTRTNGALNTRAIQRQTKPAEKIEAEGIQ